MGDICEDALWVLRRCTFCSRKHITDTLWPANPNYHPIGTAAMMSRELGGVVSPELKVYGTSNVRVVDASVLPLQFSGHLTATIYAVAQRASDMILRVNT